MCKKSGEDKDPEGSCSLLVVAPVICTELFTKRAIKRKRALPSLPLEFHAGTRSHIFAIQVARKRRSVFLFSFSLRSVLYLSRTMPSISIYAVGERLQRRHRNEH